MGINKKKFLFRHRSLEFLLKKFIIKITKSWSQLDCGFLCMYGKFKVARMYVIYKNIEIIRSEVSSC